MVQHCILFSDLIKDIKDPEKPQTLEELNVVSEDDVTVEPFADDKLHVKIVFVPTVPHCSLASLIGMHLGLGTHNLIKGLQSTISHNIPGSLRNVSGSTQVTTYE